MYNDRKEERMKNFGFIKAICFGLVLLLAGCADFRDQSPPQVTTYESLNMKLDVSTKDQVADILNSYGYSIQTKMLNFRDIVKNNKEFNSIPKSVVDFITKMSEKQSVIEVPISANKEWMKFFFDEDQKLIGFAAQGRRDILDPLITRDNKNREILINLDNSFFSKYEKSKEKKDLTIYLGKDLSCAASIHSEKKKDMTIYSVGGARSIYRAIIAMRDFFKLKK